MFHGFSDISAVKQRILELEKKISIWECKARKEDKWKKCMETWLLKNFDFDIQDDVSKLSDNDEPEEERKSEYSHQAYEEPVINSNYNNFQIARKQVYNNPHLIIESPAFNSSDENNGQQQVNTRTRNSNGSQHVRHDRDDEYQQQQISGLRPEPAHLNSQSRSSIVSTKDQPRAEHLHKRKSVSLMAERKSSSSPSSCTTPVSLQKIDSIEYASSKMRLSHSHSHIGSNITLTPLPLTSSSTINSEPGGLGIRGDKNSTSHQNNNNNNNTSAHYLSNNHAPNIGHNVSSLISTNTTTISRQLKVEDNEPEEWREEDDLPQYGTGQLEIRRQNANNEESSEGGHNSSVDLDMSEDIEEISNDVEDHHNADNLNLNHISSGDLNMFKGGTNFFSNPKNLPICSFCGKSYSSQTYLKTHIDVVHKGMKAYRCKLCGVNFGFKSDLTRHLRSHLKRKTSVV